MNCAWDFGLVPFGQGLLSSIAARERGASDWPAACVFTCKHDADMVSLGLWNGHPSSDRLVLEHCLERNQRYLGRVEHVLVEGQNPRPGHENQVCQRCRGIPCCTVLYPIVASVRHSILSCWPSWCNCGAFSVLHEPTRWFDNAKQHERAKRQKSCVWP